MARLVDSDGLSQFMRDSRAADTQTVSNVAEAQQLIQSFLGRSATGAWPSLDRQMVGNRLRQLVANPRLFQQGGLNLCGPATFFCMWTARDPVGFAHFAIRLFEEGRASIGSLDVVPSSELLQNDYMKMLTRMQKNPAPQADWMTLGAIRNNNDALFVWTGDPTQELSGLTRPEELSVWLDATGIYSHVSNEANWATSAGWLHASDLLHYGGQDIALLLNTNALIGGTARSLRNWNDPKNAPEPIALDNPVTLDDRFLINQFPNHYVMLLNSPITNYDPADSDKGTVWLSLWSWGQSLSFEVSFHAFVDNYYGAIIARLP